MQFCNTETSLRLVLCIVTIIFAHYDIFGEAKQRKQQDWLAAQDVNDLTAKHNATWVLSGSTLRAQTRMPKGSIIFSPNKRIYLILQNDCHLALFDRFYETQPRWEIETSAVSCDAMVQSDGQLALVTKDANGIPFHVFRGPKTLPQDVIPDSIHLRVQDDGNIILAGTQNGASTTLWSPNAHFPLPDVPLLDAHAKCK